MVLGDPRIMLNTNNAVKIVYQVISNSEILCERFQTFLYDLSGVFGQLMHPKMAFILKKRKKMPSSLNLFSSYAK